MQDIRLIKDEAGDPFDIEIENGDIVSVNSFDTAINASLLINARAGTKVFKPELRGGWLGNLATTVKGRQLGSLLWLLSQSRLTQSTANEAVDYVRKALSWMIEDKICKNITITSEIIPKLGIQIKIDILTWAGVLETRYYNLWENTVINAY